MAQFGNCPHCLTSAKGRRVTTEEFLECLRRADADEDGAISQQELHRALRDLGLHFAGWKARRAMGRADGNRNRRIDNDRELDELVEFARRKWGILAVDE